VRRDIINVMGKVVIAVLTPEETENILNLDANVNTFNKCKEGKI